MRTLVAIDPGALRFAFAVFKDQELVNVGEYRVKDVRALPDKARAVHYGYQPTDCVVECPSRSWKGEQSDSMRVAYAAGLIAGQFVGAVAVDPRDWKGSVPKHIHQARILKHLTDVERELLDGYSSTALRDIVDAVGIGLHRLGRMG